MNKKIELLKNELIFNAGWTVKKTISFWNKEWDLEITFEAFYVTDKINDSQINSFSMFLDKLNEYSQKTIINIKEYINKYSTFSVNSSNDILKYIELKEIFIRQDGFLIILAESDIDPENGIGIQIIPKIEIGPQDTFI